MTANNRTTDRVPTESMIRLTVSGDSSEQKGPCLNLSSSGVFIGMKEPLPRGTALHLIIELEPVGKMVEVEGEVVWRRPVMPDPMFPPGVGVKFTRIGDEAHRLVQATIDEIRRRHSIATPGHGPVAPSAGPAAPAG